MPRSRTADLPQRQSTRGPPSLRTSSSDSDPAHHRLRTEKSPKLSEGRSLKGAQTDPPVTQKKLGTRIADLESQLGQAQEELKSLKDQLTSAESAKKAAQDQLEKKSKKPQKIPEPVEIQDREHPAPVETQSMKIDLETSEDAQQETDVFEVTVEKKERVESKTELDPPADQDELKTKPIGLSTETPAILKPDDPIGNELSLKTDEMICLKKMLEEKEKEMEVLREENEKLKSQLDEKSTSISSAQATVEELTTKLNEVSQELEESKSNALQINEKLEATEKAKEELETEMKRLRVQTEQWRKAADAAASVLAGGVDVSGRKISERCGSMDKQYGNAFDSIGRYTGYVGSPGFGDETDDVFGSGKRKGSGIKMFGDLWKKRGQK